MRAQLVVRRSATGTRCVVALISRFRSVNCSLSTRHVRLLPQLPLDARAGSECGGAARAAQRPLCDSRACAHAHTQLYPAGPGEEARTQAGGQVTTSTELSSSRAPASRALRGGLGRRRWAAWMALMAPAQTLTGLSPLQTALCCEPFLWALRRCHSLITALCELQIETHDRPSRRKCERARARSVQGHDLNLHYAQQVASAAVRRAHSTLAGTVSNLCTRPRLERLPTA
jgi:hypothetical protein